MAAKELKPPNIPAELGTTVDGDPSAAIFTIRTSPFALARQMNRSAPTVNASTRSQGPLSGPVVCCTGVVGYFTGPNEPSGRTVKTTVWSLRLLASTRYVEPPAS